MPMPQELRALILRFNRVGCLLDDVDEDAIRAGDAAALASAKLIVAEMNKVRGEIDTFLDQAQLKPSPH
jgi:hypothetical protein